MAREEKRVELRPVDDLVERQAPVIRLESKETLERGKPVRLIVPAEESKTSHRLDVPIPPDFEIRTHQPGIDVLIESPAANPDLLEHGWDKKAAHHRSIPWGWFALIGLLLIGSVIWSLTQVQEASDQADEIVVSTKSVLENEAKEDIEASNLIEKIEATSRKFFAATSPEILARYARHPERIKPLISQHYSTYPLVPSTTLRTNSLQPFTLDNRANFWMQSVQLQNREIHNLIIEIDESGEPKIDWETLVCYQPMKWDTFALTRPSGTSFDFRVYAEADNFFSHEFIDSNLWNCFRLTALDSNETLFGYAKIDAPASTELLSLLHQNQGRRVSVILRVNVPEGIHSRRGIVIEKVLSPRWIYLNPPDA
jgi:hypothetical protein